MKPAKNKVPFMIKLAAFQATGWAYMKLHEIMGHFREVPRVVTEYRLRRPHPYKILIHEYEDEKNQIRSHV